MYVPDVGETFTITRSWPYRKWQWLPVPWYRRRVVTETHSYRVGAWLRRRPPRPAPRTEQERVIREVMTELLAEGRTDPPRGFGPDNVPLDFCLREEAEYVEGVGVGGIIVRVSDVVITGSVNWPPERIEEARRHAESLAGEQLR